MNRFSRELPNMATSAHPQLSPTPSNISQDDGPNDENLGESNSAYVSSLHSESSLNSHYFRSYKLNTNVEDRIRRNLKFFFMNPYEKWKAKRRFPWKLLLQFVKIILITSQLTLFGEMHSSYVTFVERNTIALKHIFLRGWAPGFETLPYPPATGLFAVYVEKKLYEKINYAMEEYYEHPIEEDLGVGGYQLMYSDESTEHDKHRVPMIFCLTEFKNSEVYPNGSFTFDSQEVTQCFEMNRTLINETSRTHGRGHVQSYDIKAILEQLKYPIAFDVLLNIKVIFPLRSINLETYSKQAAPKCYTFNVTILFDNQRHDGQMVVDLLTDAAPIKCNGTILYSADNQLRKGAFVSFYVIIILVSFASMALCIRSLFRAFKTQKVVVKYFQKAYNKKLPLSDRLEFLNMWYTLIIANDVITIIATALLLQDIATEVDDTTTNLNTIGLLLGTGSLFTWFGVLRYIGFFKKYNVLLITLKRAFPNVLRFLVCAAIVYCAFMFCGWVVLGPYHIKFRTLTSTSECMFALINGDDMYATFTSLTTSSGFGIWVYCRVYLYTFISLFIYIVLSLFIAVIMDSYETIKYYYQNGFPKSDLFEFIDKCDDTPSSPAFRNEGSGCCWGICNCCGRTMSDEDTEVVETTA